MDVALLVYRDGALALEHYEAGADETTRFNSFSMAKSLVGALIYRALAEGKLQSLDQTLGELLPDDHGIAHVTLRRLLAMRAGIHFDEESKLGTASGKDSDTTPNPFGPLARLHFQGLGAIETGLRGATTDDDAFNYQNVNTALLGEILERLYDRPLEQLLAEKLWLAPPHGAGRPPACRSRPIAASTPPPATGYASVFISAPMAARTRPFCPMRSGANSWGSMCR